MIAALEKLGFKIVADESAKTITVSGQGGEIPNKQATIPVGNAGTAARFLTAFLCLQKGGAYHLDGDPAMRKRPMAGLLNALEGCGAATVTYDEKEGHFPFTLNTLGASNGTIKVDASASSQMLSALLMVAPLLDDLSTIEMTGDTVSRPFVEMTLQMMQSFGGYVTEERDTFTIGNKTPYHLSSPEYVVEPDATAASYFFALPLATGGGLIVDGHWGALQGDLRFIDVIKKTGLSMTSKGRNVAVKATGEQKGNLNEDFNDFSDTFLTLAALSPLLDGMTRISGIKHTNEQESKRVDGMATELKKLGQGVVVSDDKDVLTITPNLDALKKCSRKAREAGALLTVETCNDHRFAMSFGILGCHDLHGDGEPWLQIANPSCCRKTFPDFFKMLDSLRD